MLYQQAWALAELARQRYDALITLYEQHGPVFRLDAGRIGHVHVLGPEASRWHDHDATPRRPLGDSDLAAIGQDCRRVTSPRT